MQALDDIGELDNTFMWVLQHGCQYIRLPQSAHVVGKQCMLCACGRGAAHVVGGPPAAGCWWLDHLCAMLPSLSTICVPCS